MALGRTTHQRAVSPRHELGGSIRYLRSSTEPPGVSGWRLRFSADRRSGGVISVNAYGALTRRAAKAPGSSATRHVEQAWHQEFTAPVKR
jgi:hypothetical protein